MNELVQAAKNLIDAIDRISCTNFPFDLSEECAALVDALNDLEVGE